jgi:hypothetical protein
MTASMLNHRLEDLQFGQIFPDSGFPDSGREDCRVVPVGKSVHWADPTTLDLLRGIAERGARMCGKCWRRTKRSGDKSRRNNLHSAFKWICFRPQSYNRELVGATRTGDLARSRLFRRKTHC